MNNISVDGNKTAKIISNFFDYLCNGRNKPIQSGIEELDSFLIGGFRPMLYFIDYPQKMNLSKSMLINLAEELAKNGHNVMFFYSYVSTIDLMARSLTRITYSHSKETAQTKDEILLCDWKDKKVKDLEALSQAEQEMLTYSNKLKLFRRKKSHEIIEAIRTEADKGTKPIIIIDYIDSQYYEVLETIKTKYEIPMIISMEHRTAEYSKISESCSIGTVDIMPEYDSPGTYTAQIRFSELPGTSQALSLKYRPKYNHIRIDGHN